MGLSKRRRTGGTTKTTTEARRARRSATDGSDGRARRDGDAGRRGPDGRRTTSTAGPDPQATTPTGISGGGWKAIGSRVVKELKRDHVSLLAAGVAFKALLALFPAIIAAFTIWGMVADPQQIQSQVTDFTSALPESASQLLQDQMSNVASQGSSTLSIALAISVLLALWSASAGVAGLIEGCNAAYNEVDGRGFVKKRGLALLFTVGAIVFLILAIGLIAVLPAVLGTVGLGSAAETAIRIAQWPALALLVMAALAIVYKYGPDRDDPRFRWASVGAVIATVLWLLGSALFTLYVENFGSFGETYGTFAGIIVLMLWLFLSSFVVLLGAEINAEMERQTTHDTTIGEPAPMGRRDAVVADTTPEQYASRRE